MTAKNSTANQAPAMEMGFEEDLVLVHRYIKDNHHMNI